MTDRRVKPLSTALGTYLTNDYQLIPLFPYHARKTVGNKQREEGKRPRDVRWTTRPYSNDEQVEWMDGGGNVGVRLRPTDLVIDVDPRNFPEGTDSLDELCSDLSLDLSDAPTVHTGSGGRHIYMRKPADVTVVDTLEGYDGVEFKTRGRQVVSAGSVHPNGRHYEWDVINDDLSDASPAPPELLRIIARPRRTHTTTGGGEHTQEEIASMLDRLDPEDFRDHDGWLRLMMACHSASNGDARSEFTEWSTRDPQYEADAWSTGRRWDSLHTDMRDGVGVGTLHKVMRDAGEGEHIPRPSAEEDFKNVGAEDAPGPVETHEDGAQRHEKSSWVKDLNKKYWAVDDNGRFRVMYRGTDDLDRVMWISSTKQDWTDKLGYMRTEDPNTGKVVPITKAWLEWPGHNRAEGVIFDPERDHPDKLNLWDGWPIQPRKGDWSIMRELIEDVLCDRDPEAIRYVLHWMANMVQRPGSPAEVAICLRGDKGTGKSTLGNALTLLCGRHGMAVASSELLTGRFNYHLRDVICLFADEAVRATDKAGENVLKALITEHHLAYEKKHKDVFMAKNHVHLIMASNDQWVVPASIEERRFFVSHVNNDRLGDRTFFGALHEQMYGDGQRGLRAMMFDLMTMPIGEWRPRDEVPRNRALGEQKLGSLGPVGQWWTSLLEAGSLPFEPVTAEDDWTLDRVRVFKQEVREDYERWCRTNGIRPGNMGRTIDYTFAKELRSLCPGVRTDLLGTVDDVDHPTVRGNPSDGRAPCYELPSLSECRDTFAGLMDGLEPWKS